MDIEKHIQDMTDPSVLSMLLGGEIRFYAGFDPTSPSLQLGNLYVIKMMQRLMSLGNEPVVLLGGATGLIGDPSGKTRERTLQNYDVVLSNVTKMKSQIERLIPGVLVVNNLDWFQDFSVLDFLRDIGKHFRINEMLVRESVASRMKSTGMSLTEFVYQTMQAYDFLMLHDSLGVTLQMGGSDQFGNICSGVSLVRKVRNRKVFGLTIPLITDKSGKKFGKSERGTIFCDPELTTPYDMFQFLVNVPDDQSIYLLDCLTDVEPDQIEELLSKPREERHFQKRLAEDVVRFIHGEEVLRNVVSSSNALFGGDTSETKSMIFEVGDVSLEDALVSTSLFSSKSDVRRVADQGGLRINGIVTRDVKAMAISFSTRFEVMRGKRSRCVVRVSGAQ